jgi:hypothetical protein
VRKTIVMLTSLLIALSPVGPATAATPAAGTQPQIVTWQAYQRPAVNGVEQINRITEVAAAPGPALRRPAERILRFELRAGDVTDTGGFRANRSEVYGRASAASTPPAEWLDPVGSIRWYDLSLFVPTDFTTAADTSWVVFTQWKGLRGGSPPIGLEIKRNGLRLGGTRTNSGLIPNDGYLGPLNKGAWTRLTVGLSLSPDPSVGWVEVWRNGELTLPRTAAATMDVVNGAPDPVYLKQGLYRGGPAWSSCTHVLFLGPTRVGATYADVTR